MLIIPVDADTELRQLQESDAPALFLLVEHGRAYLREWLPWVDSTRTVEDTLEFVRVGTRQWDLRNSFHAGIWHQGRITGVISYNYLDWPQHKTEIGYWLGQAFQRRGLMTSACRAMTSYAFDVLKLERVDIYCSVENYKSRAIPERLGFKEEGIRPRMEWLHYRYVDCVLYSMTAAEWRKPAAPKGTDTDS